MSEIGVIGGSGVYTLDNAKLVKEHDVSTPFGPPSDVIIEAEIEGSRCFFLPRHGRGHKVLPHEINYCANIYALKSLGVEYLISVSAVGSLREDLPPGTFFLPDQFIDWTKGLRRRSFFGEGVIAHVSTAYPIEPQLRDLIEDSCKNAEVDYKKDGSYICIEGPQFSSRAESEFYRTMGASVVGMTNVPESYLAKEAGLAYSTVAMVTDFDCWKDEHCAVDEIMKVMSGNNERAKRMLTHLIPELAKNKFHFKKDNKVGLMSPVESLSPKQKEWVEVLMR